MAKTVILKKGEDARLLKGHLWVYSNEIENMGDGFEPGEVVTLQNFMGRPRGKGYINPHSLIAFRLLTRDPEEAVDYDFFLRRIKEADEFRHEIMPNETTYRALYSEADYLPGLIVDRYKDYIVVQSHTMGIERQLPIICKALQEQFSPKAIVLRNDQPIRFQEGLGTFKGLFCGELEGPITIEQDGLKFMVDLLEGQKTGFFLDQRENRRLLKGLVSGKEVLDCFCYSGAFSLYAARYGAKKVLGIDSSDQAIEWAKENAKINDYEEQCTFQEGNVYDFLKEYALQGRCFDVIISDPPAYVKSKAHLKQGIDGYINSYRWVMRCVKKGGFLIACTCSHHIEEEQFLQILHHASVAAKRRVKLLQFRFQAPDHPILLGHKETRYLKCAVLYVV